jgi:hypothetical protein
MTNELSLHTWGDLRDNMPLFRAYHQALFDEMKKRGTPVKLLSTDASPIQNWSTIEWAANNMNDISGVYGGHHYFNQYTPESPDLYPYFKEKCAWAVNLAKSKGKDFILGEFGGAQGGGLQWGNAWATSRFFDSPREPMVGVQLVEGAMAAINAGVYGIAYWTFSDEPEDTKAHLNRHWGLFKWMTAGAVPRTPYYAYGLLTKFFRGPASVHEVESGDPLVRVSAIENEASGGWSIAVVNRNSQVAALSISLSKEPAKAFRKYVFDPAHVPVTDDGDLQEPAARLHATNRQLADAVPPQSLVIYTTAYQEGPPAPVRQLEVGPDRVDWKRLRWQPSTGPDVIYYRIYQNSVRIGSTTTNEFIDGGPRRNEPGDYTVVVVDQWGNASTPQRAVSVRPAQSQPKGDPRK